MKQLEKERKGHKAVIEALDREKMRDEKLMIAKRKHEDYMNKYFSQEATKKSEATVDTGAKNGDEMEIDDLNAPNPGDQLLLDSDEVSEVSEVSDLETAIGGAARPLSSYKDTEYLDTWTIVVPAVEYKTEPGWRTIHPDGHIEFNKFSLLHDIRMELKRLCKLMTGMSKWDYSQFHTVCFEEMGSKNLSKSEIIEHMKSTDEFNLAGGKTHCHILMEYYGNDKRGTPFRCAKAFENWLSGRGWNLYHSTILDYSLRYYLKASRERQQSYLMCSMY